MKYLENYFEIFKVDVVIFCPLLLKCYPYCSTQATSRQQETLEYIYLNILQHFRRDKKKFLFKLKKVRFEISFSDRFVTEAIVWRISNNCVFIFMTQMTEITTLSLRNWTRWHIINLNRSITNLWCHIIFMDYCTSYL